ncbi:hypothetical protein FRC17_005268 [Serendipita sp. 399]|nr:hypothetical protein FRC17_005268 [Serendipita sp. 399]
MFTVRRSAATPPKAEASMVYEKIEPLDKYPSEPLSKSRQFCSSKTDEYETHRRHTILDHYTFVWGDGRMALPLGLGEEPTSRMEQHLIANRISVQPFLQPKRDVYEAKRV